jgi:fructoselysine-6-P-deglycase FrlB-like protein
MITSTLSSKLDQLPATLELVSNFDPAAMATSLTLGAGRHALAIGSGGSAVAAEYFVRCRDSLGLGPTSVATPMQAVVDHNPLNASQVWLFSAGGDNPDVVAAAQATADRGCADLILVTRNPDSVAAGVIRRLNGSVHVVPVADLKDGFLTTHSLLAMATALLLASDMASREPVPKSTKLDILARRLAASRDGAERHRLLEQWKGLRPNDTIIIAADPLLRPVASLLDTSFWESALCPVQTTDFRNLAHGRHAWFHHRPDDTVLLALTGATSRLIWSAIDEVLPDAVRRTKSDYGSCGRLENLLGFVDGLAVIEAIGEVLGIDPGKPGIGKFGRAIYGDRSLERLAAELSTRVRHKRAAIAKADVTNPDEPSLASISRERLHLLEAADVGGLVFDYDGTIVSTEGRYEVPDQPIVDELVRLHRAGVWLGIATGRGGSAGEDLRKVLPPEVLSSIIIGYYNGGYLRTADFNIELDPPAQNPAIAAVASWLNARDDLFIKKSFKSGTLQIGIEMSILRHPYRFALDFSSCPQFANGEVRISASGHSFDIIPLTSCKTSVVEAVRRAARPGTTVLCFGDSGSASGNDHALLSHPHGISVDEVCSAPDGCWSLFGGMITGTKALLKALSCLVPSEQGGIRMDMSKLPLDSR